MITILRSNLPGRLPKPRLVPVALYWVHHVLLEEHEVDWSLESRTALLGLLRRVLVTPGAEGVGALRLRVPADHAGEVKQQWSDRSKALATLLSK